MDKQAKLDARKRFKPGTLVSIWAKNYNERQVGLVVEMHPLEDEYDCYTILYVDKRGRIILEESYYPQGIANVIET